MKKELIINMEVVRKHGANTAVVLAVIKNSYEPMTITEVSNAVGISFPTAHKCLDKLAGENLIKAFEKVYSKL